MNMLWLVVILCSGSPERCETKELAWDGPLLSCYIQGQAIIHREYPDRRIEHMSCLAGRPA